MILSINPTYYCNFRCDFCYLTKDQLGDRQLLGLDQLVDLLAEIDEPVEHVDLYGGELGLLKFDYWDKLITILQMFGIEDINLNTNLSMVNEITTDPRVYTSVSFDFDARESHERVFRNMALLDKKFSVLMLASPKLIKGDVDSMIQTFNMIPNLETVEIKPYSSNQANQLDVSYREYEEFVKKWIINTDRTFDVNNEYLLNDVLSGSRNAFSDDHVYITPNGKFAVLEFDENDNEYFKELNSFWGYRDWCKVENKRVSENKFCSNCNYFGKCLSEHLREVKDTENSCNGFIHLIEWFDRNGRLES